MNLKLVKKIDEARGTKSFFFESNEKITWEAGQYIYITLPNLNYPDERGATRHFTISSSPTEGDLIRITIRIREESGYKKTLDELPMESIVEGKGPQGTFVFDKESFSDSNKNTIFLAGGIGITPFRSMIKYNIDTNLKAPIYLLQSNSDGEFVFKNELDKLLQTEENNLKLNYFDSSINGHLDKEKLEKIVKNWNLDINKSVFYIVGPNKFVYAMEDILSELKITEDNIKTEKFTGY